ncbi:MAG: bifunctional hydroxymethylpyrimidine kinase/phosphomethylpyrimidine kinase [Acidobacteriaceae bacterium]
MSDFSSPATTAQRTLLTIAGHDPSSGAGITADLKTFSAHRFFGTSVLTALTVQSTLGVEEVRPVDAAFLRHALDHLAADLPPAGIKIGMLGSVAAVTAVGEFLAARLAAIHVPAAARVAGHEPNVRQPVPPIVLDPILRSTSGADLLPADAIELLHQTLLPLVTWITPNWRELTALTTLPVETLAEAEAASRALARRHPHLHIVATAGDHSQPTDLLLLPSGDLHRYAGEHIESNATHGTGCAFSSSLLCHLILRDTPVEAVRGAKHFVAEAIRHAPNLGHGNGPLHLFWQLR